MRILLPSLAFLFLLISCKQASSNDNSATEATEAAAESTEFTEEMKKEFEVIEAYLKENNLEAKKTASGLYYIINEEGDGPKAQPGQTVNVHYRGTLLDGKQFDSSFDRGTPIDFKLGVGMVIKGWDEGIALLNVGGKGKLIIPSFLGYGKSEIKGLIPANSILLFDVELVSAQ